LHDKAKTAIEIIPFRAFHNRPIPFVLAGRDPFCIKNSPDGIIKDLIFVWTRISPLTPTLSPESGGEGRVMGSEPSILF